MARSIGETHAEQNLIQQAGFRRVVDLYSERQPCQETCEPLTEGMNSSWSFRWNPPGALRAAGKNSFSGSYERAFPETVEKVTPAMNVEYPRFETQVFAASPEVAELFADLPAARHALFEEGIPKEIFGGGYSADVDLTVHEWEGRAPIVRFGSSGLAGLLGMDLSNGHVIKVIDVPAKPMLLVNTTVDQFALTVRAMTERFPYYAKTAEYEEMD